MDDPRPAAVRGPVVAQPQATEFQTDETASNPVTQFGETPGADFKSFGGFVSNANILIYNVPAGYDFICKSVVCTSTSSSGVFATLRRVGSDVAQAYLSVQGAQVDLVSGQGVVSFLSGDSVRIVCGSGGGSFSYSITGYLQSNAATNPPALAQLDAPGIG